MLILAIMRWHCQIFLFAHIINKFLITVLSNAVIPSQFSKCKPRNLSNKHLLLDLFLVITFIVWWYIYIFTLNKSILFMKMRPIIIFLDLTHDFQISWLKLPIIKYINHYGMSLAYFLITILLVTNSTGIIIAFSISKSIKTCCILYHQSAICISLYIYLSLSTILGFSRLFIKSY